MDISKLKEWQLRDVRRRVEQGKGRFVDLKITSYVEQLDIETNELKLEPFETTRTYFVGEINPDQTVPVLSVLGSVFMGLSGDEQLAELNADAQAGGGENGVLSFTKYIKGDHLVALVAAILGETPQFVHDNWSFPMVLKVGGAFFRYNPFSELVQAAMELVGDLGAITAGLAGTPR